MKLSRNEMKLSFKTPKYFVNEKKGTVKCVLNYNVIVPYDADHDFPSLPSGERTVIAVSECNKNDTFNVLVGKKIALAKAENQAYAEASDAISVYLYSKESMLRLFEILGNFKDKSRRCISHNYKYIKRLTD